MSSIEINTTIVKLNPKTDLNRIKDYWQNLAQNNCHSYFHSWGWVETWLCSLGDRATIEFVFAIEGSEPVCGFILGKRFSVRHKLIPKHWAILNNTGLDDIDELTVEYNQALSKPGRVGLNLLFNECLGEIEEFHLPLLANTTALNLQIPDGFHSTQHVKVPSYYVDLRMLRESYEGYAESLSSKNRRMLKRSLEHYENQGAITVRPAETCEQAHSMLLELKKLHDLRWSKRAHAGAFSSSFFTSFHQKLIDARFDYGEIQLLEISNEFQTIGYLYNFVHQNEVLFYQSGLNYSDDKKARPGIVCHYHAILYNQNGGKNLYNFLAGDSRYKRSLSTGQDCLHTITVARDSWKSAMENVLRSIKSIRSEQSSEQ